ncbi:hypothetical protein TNCV_1253161 [Trichonephila clavipes]|nr:hypothetical protein TNCV_1253161 [Trichonephila clavipes]
MTYSWLVGNRLVGCLEKQPYQRFSKVGIRTHSPSLEYVTAIRANLSKSLTGVFSEEFYCRTGTLYCASIDTNRHPRLFPTNFSSSNAQGITEDRHTKLGACEKTTLSPPEM